MYSSVTSLIKLTQSCSNCYLTDLNAENEHCLGTVIAFSRFINSIFLIFIYGGSSDLKLVLQRAMLKTYLNTTYKSTDTTKGILHNILI